MHTATHSAPNTTIVGIADQLLDRFDAAQFIRETVGVPIEAVDLERHAKAGTGPVFRRWGRRPLYRRSDLTTWALDRLSPPIKPRREATWCPLNPVNRAIPITAKYARARRFCKSSRG
jgi:hypothetical protein